MSSAADCDIIKMKVLATLIIGVAFLGVTSGENNQSQLSIPGEEPMADQKEGKRRDTPEVVLQLKYDGGELNRIYLTQFRKPTKYWSPSVNVQTNLCADLCHAGLGGDACGSTCPQLLPVGLKSALTDANITDVSYGQPRVGVCPALCSNHLGQPLCECQEDVEEEQEAKAVHWTEVCQAFCADGYAMTGCPACESMDPQPLTTISSFRALNTAEGWQTWCNIQCPQGNGGLACNCDRAPFQ